MEEVWKISPELWTICRCAAAFHILSLVADSDSFGKRLRAARVAAGISQTALGEKVGATRQTVRTWELDLNRPYPDNIARIAEALGIESSSLFPPPSASLTEAQRLDVVEAKLRDVLAALEAHNITLPEPDALPGQGLREIAERDAQQSSGPSEKKPGQRRTSRGS